MIGLKECGISTIKTIHSNLVHPEWLCYSLSRNTQLVLQVAHGIVFPESAVPPGAFRKISNLIYAANNYFDVGLAAWERIYNHRDVAFPLLMLLHAETHSHLQSQRQALVSTFPNSIDKIDNFINDGCVLFRHRKEISSHEYRELDSGISATLWVGLAGEESQLSKIGIPNNSCHNLEDLQNKYQLFCVSNMNTDSLPEDRCTREIVGLQAIEMILACIDDRWGKDTDKIFGLPNTAQGGDSKILIKKYREIAIKCGYSPLVVDTTALLVNTHKIKTSTIKDTSPIEPSDTLSCRGVGSMYLLREWLLAHSLATEIF